MNSGQHATRQISLIRYMPTYTEQVINKSLVLRKVVGICL